MNWYWKDTHLMKMLILYSNAPTEKIDNDYDGVFEHLKHKKLLNFLGKDKKDAFLKELEDKDKE